MGWLKTCGGDVHPRGDGVATCQPVRPDWAWFVGYRMLDADVVEEVVSWGVVVLGSLDCVVEVF